MRAPFLARPTGQPIDIDAVHADVQRRFPKVLEALRQSEIADELEGLRITEEICADRIRRHEAKIATVFATPAMQEIRHLIEHLSFAQIDEIVARVRREVWKDFSNG